MYTTFSFCNNLHLQAKESLVNNFYKSYKFRGAGGGGGGGGGMVREV